MAKRQNSWYVELVFVFLLPMNALVKRYLIDDDGEVDHIAPRLLLMASVSIHPDLSLSAQATEGGASLRQPRLSRSEAGNR